MENGKIPNRLKRKLALKQEKYKHSTFSLDPVQYTWDPFCRKKDCYGRGYTGFETKSKKYMLCSCASRMKRPAEVKK